MVITGTGSKIRDVSIRIVMNRWFEVTVMTCIILNTVVLASKAFMQPKEMEPILNKANLVFNFVFTAEAIIKIVALKTNYFHEGWNVFDFSIVTLTYIFLLFEATGILQGFGQTTTILRALRIGRVLRLINKAKKL